MSPANIEVPVAVTAVVVASTRGGFAAVRRRQRACVFAANAAGTTVRQHATLPTAVGFANIAKLAKLGVGIATCVNKRLSAVF